MAFWLFLIPHNGKFTQQRTIGSLKPQTYRQRALFDHMHIARSEIPELRTKAGRKLELAPRGNESSPWMGYPILYSEEERPPNSLQFESTWRIIWKGVRHWSVCRDIRTDKRHARDIVNLLALCPSTSPANLLLPTTTVVCTTALSLLIIGFAFGICPCHLMLSCKLTSLTVQIVIEWNRGIRESLCARLCPLCAPTFRSTLKSEIFTNCFLTHINICRAIPFLVNSSSFIYEIVLIPVFVV